MASNRCDKNDIWTGKVEDPGVSRGTYGTAQKMHAAVSHKFGRDYQLGTQPWLEHPAMPGKFSGNPSLSATISQYMVSLHQQKVCVLDEPPGSLTPPDLISPPSTPFPYHFRLLP
jgi:hypothetical protein